MAGVSPRCSETTKEKDPWVHEGNAGSLLEEVTVAREVLMQRPKQVQWGAEWEDGWERSQSDVWISGLLMK